jgi:hypothetical protein
VLSNHVKLAKLNINVENKRKSREKANSKFAVAAAA